MSIKLSQRSGCNHTECFFLGNKPDEDQSQQPGVTRRLEPIRGDEKVEPFVSREPAEIIPWVIEFRIADSPDVLQVQVRDSMVVGRGEGAGGPEVDLAPYRAIAKGVSRRHAIILAREKFLTLRDLNSTNGTRINDLLLDPGQDVPLQHGDELTFGALRVQLMFAVLPPQQGATPDSDRSALEQPAPEGNGLHVLVIEDDADVALVYQMMLQGVGYRVSLAETPEQAAKIVAHEKPEAVILDLMLQESNGIDLIHVLRREIGDKVPMMVVSGVVGGHQKQQAFQAGASAFMGKPVRVDMLVMRLAQLIATANET